MRLTFVPLTLALALTANAQDDAAFSCKANDPAFIERITGNDPALIQRMQLAEAELNAHTHGFVRDRGQGYVIPVVFHIIHTHGAENISDAQIRDAVRILNEDYNKENPDWTTVRPTFLDRVADIGITFRLAQLDPEGACTSGITRTVSTLTNEGNHAMTQLIQWPRERYLNIWVGAEANGAAGYTNYPWILDGSPENDGIVVKANYVGSIGTGSALRSRVLSHEVGHWLNLRHCWGNSNNPGLEENCETDDDVEDTPLTKGWTSCTLSGASCGSELDNVENYMEYSYCDKMFTQGQADRMIAALTSPVADRMELWQPGNLSITGVQDEPWLCGVDFGQDRVQICAGGSISFTDLSFNQVTAREWAFPGGTPSASTEASLQVLYAEPGIYPVTLTVSDGVNTLSTTRSVAVDVIPFPGMEIPFSDGFETTATLAGSEWTVLDPDSDGGFEVTTSGASSGLQSVHLVNNAFMNGRIDELVSPTYDLSEATGVTLTFRYAFAKRLDSDQDRLGVLVSNSCGMAWSLRRQILATSALVTGGVVPGAYVPTAEEWEEVVVTNIGVSQQVGGFRFKFQFTHGGGNDLYLDDINLNGQHVGLEEFTSSTGLRAWPNPAQDLTTIGLELDRTDRVSVELTDLLGRTVMTPRTMQLPAGTHRIEVPLTGLASGTYLLLVRGTRSEQVTKLQVDRSR